MANSDKDESAAVARERHERYVEGLREELRGYEQRPGKEERADQVRDELRRLGVDHDAPRGRRAPTKQAAAGMARPAPETAGQPAKTTTDQPGVDVD